MTDQLDPRTQHPNGQRAGAAIEASAHPAARGAVEGQARCPLCGAASQSWCRSPDRHQGVVGEWAVYQCSGCRHRFQWPIPTEEDLAAAYPESYYAYQGPNVDFRPSPFRNRAVWLRLHHLKRHLGYDQLPVSSNPLLAFLGRLASRFPLDFGSPPYRTGGRLLDYGSGAGEKMAFARYTGWHAEGIEMSGAAAEVGRKSGLEIHHGTVEVLEAKPGRYDHIMSSHCVEHVPDVQRLLRAFFTALEPGGTIALDVPNGASEAADHFKELFYHLAMPVHVHLFTPQGLRSLVEEAGFEGVRLASYSRLEWHAMSQMLRRPIGLGPDERIEFQRDKRLLQACASVLALPPYLRSLRHLKGDCLVLTAVKPPAGEQPGAP